VRYNLLLEWKVVLRLLLWARHVESISNALVFFSDYVTKTSVIAFVSAMTSAIFASLELFVVGV
jgi:hypothetical protein